MNAPDPDDHAEAKRARQELFEVFMQAPVPMCVMTGPEHRFTLANTLFVRFVSREVLGKALREAFTDQEGGHVFPSIDRVYRTGQPYVWQELPITLPDAKGVLRDHFLNVSYTALRDGAGAVTAVTCTVVDVSDQVRARNAVAQANATLEVERDNFGRLFDQTTGFMAIFRGPEFVYEYMNPMNRRILGGDFTGKRLRDVIPDVERTGLLALFERVYRTGEREVIHELALQIGSERRYFDATYVARRNAAGEIDGVMTWGLDTTLQVRDRQRVEDVVRELEAERELRERFVAMLSHDLRTPITAVKLGAQLIAKRADDPNDVRKLATRIGDGAARAENMIRDLLDANRIGAGEQIPIEVGACCLNTVVTEVIEDLSTIHGARFRLDGDERIEGRWSCSALRRIVENLLTNAIKYGEHASPVRIALRRGDRVAQIAIHNQGPPIAAEQLGNLFQPYRRTESAIRSGEKGWGLGLTLVKGLAEAHGGTVDVESSLERGTTFTVTLPLANCA